LKPEKQPHWILKAIAEQSAPRDAIHLWPSIEARLAAPKTARAQKFTFRLSQQGTYEMKKIFLYGLVLLVVVFGATMAFVPAARAQVTGWVSGQVAEFAFGTSAGMPKVSLISAGPWGFEPLNPTYLPRGSWVIVPDS
jgi:hypothetical protein